MQINVAKRLQQTEEYYFSKKLREIDELNKSGARVINLGIGSPDLPPHPEVIQTLHEQASLPNTHGYQNYKGSPVLRKAIADWYERYYRVSLNPEKRDFTFDRFQRRHRPYLYDVPAGRR
ncbi:aminotransferase class I/II-fold pyridoxal phosphate-dependent enzyme [Sphingobacterium spiritivorum]|uniref:aminotransferase class I/II-fold pyridoxal phosphate-dependent enzyme n=1 Tax=Sphingobacterium spiritivorum TaxID=258 RepID=UPI0021D31D0B|nr:aminotransferase class I/II-fold pyridoxal phosphate-dependent enzyme [Sphingobacterium spiritivorum]